MVKLLKLGGDRNPWGFLWIKLSKKNIRLQGSFSHNWPIWEKVIELLSNGTLDVKPIIGGVWPISDWEKAFKEMHSGKIIKSVLKPV
jgi:alcohol dehydrogenase/L-iditol 2-dehydrogenase